mgnify:CR=1 FL=1
MLSKNIFRPDIQILRGFSVLLVLLYHFDFKFININFIKAGYIGVDIFFVISGYIITKIIYEDQNFSLVEFYKKRIKRLFPALLTVLIISIAVSILIFNLFVLKKNLESVNSIFFGASNYYFWFTSTIYGFAEKNNLLFLHTWSLAIEYQFFLIYPITFLIFKKNLIKYILLIMFILSYLSIFYIYQNHPIFNFYFSFSRVFEIVSGCLAYIYSKKIRVIVKQEFHSFFYYFGFILIIFFMLFLHRASYHPNPSAIMFVLGTSMMLIFFNKNLEFLYRLKIQKIGSISYSLYLWHFPIIVLFNYYFIEFNDLIKIIALLISLIISIISFYYIENKFRRASFDKTLFYSILLIILLTLITNHFKTKEYNKKIIQFDNSYLREESNLFLTNKNKLSWRKTKNIFIFKNDYKKFSPIFTDKDNTKILFIGDSFSKDIFNVFYTHKEFYKNFEFARYGINIDDINTKRLKNLIESKTFQKAKIIYLSSRYKETDIDLISKWIDLIKKYNKKLIIQLKKPEFKGNNTKNQTFIDELLAKNIYNISELNNHGYQNLNSSNFIRINKLIKNKYSNKAILFDLFPIICSELEKKCDMLDNKNQKYFYDYGHFTIYGSKFFGSKIIENEIYKLLF